MTVVVIVGALAAMAWSQSVLAEKDSTSCRADVVFLMDSAVGTTITSMWSSKNVALMQDLSKSTKRTAGKILDAISGDDPRFKGIDVKFGVTDYGGDTATLCKVRPSDLRGEKVRKGRYATVYVTYARSKTGGSGIVARLNGKGELQATWNGTEWGAGKSGAFIDLADIATDSAGNIYVVDQGAHKVRKFSSPKPPKKMDDVPKQVLEWGSSGSADGQFNSPWGITIDGDDNVYVADTGNHRIQKFDTFGKHVLTWGGFGTTEGRFNSPIGIATDGGGNVYVADRENNRVQKFDASGNFHSKIGSAGCATRKYCLYKPWAIEVTPDHVGTKTVDETMIYTTSRAQHRVQEFDASGKWLRDLHITHPVGIGVGRSGYVWVARDWDLKPEARKETEQYHLSWGQLYKVLGVSKTFESGWKKTTELVHDEGPFPKGMYHSNYAGRFPRGVTVVGGLDPLSYKMVKARTSYWVNQQLTKDKSAAKLAITDLSDFHNGDGGLFALHQLATEGGPTNGRGYGDSPGSKSSDFLSAPCGGTGGSGNTDAVYHACGVTLGGLTTRESGSAEGRRATLLDGGSAGMVLTTPDYGGWDLDAETRKKFCSHAVGWRANAKRVIVWFGESPSRNTTVNRREAISALNAKDIAVVAVNPHSEGQGLDECHQLSDGKYKAEFHLSGDRTMAGCGKRGFSKVGDPTAIARATGGAVHHNVKGGKHDVEAILKSISAGIIQASGSQAKVSFSEAKLTSTVLMYVPKLYGKDGTGDLEAWKLDPKSGAIDSKAWSAATRMDAVGMKRHAFSADKDGGYPLNWTECQKRADCREDFSTHKSGTADGDGALRLKWLLGDKTHEGSRFRKRASLMAGVRSSSPVYVGRADGPWWDGMAYIPKSKPYSEFKKKMKKRRPIVYVGSSGGPLHAFDADSGDEIFAYFPRALFSNRTGAGYHRLSEDSFNHKNVYVDGTPLVNDAYFDSAWRTVLVGTLGNGGRGIFALEVTDPLKFKSSVDKWQPALWEFANGDDAHLGYTFSRPTIVLLNNGRWAAITGNGLDDTATDSTGGQSQLFIIYLDGGIDGTWTYGSDYLRIPTGSGSSGSRNGLFTPAIVDLDGNGTADRVYAGDLKANLWAFDLSSSDQNSWGVAHGKKPLFSGNANQPITLQPTVIHHPTEGSGAKPNLMVLFGTGRFLSGADKTRSYRQSFYGIWDNGTSSLERSNLAAQTFLLDDASKRARVLKSDLEVKYAGASGRQYGWYIDLPTTGERVVSEALVRDNIVYFNTIIPDISVCASGGSGWEMSVKTDNGGSPDEAAFDFNGNLIVGDPGDSYTIAGEKGKESTVGYAGRKMEEGEEGKGMPAGPSIIGNRRCTPGSITDEGAEIQESALSESEQPPAGRLSWEQLFAD